MEGSQSEAVFDARDLNPQLFINEVLNTVDDLVDDAFDFFNQQASAPVSGDTGADRAEELRQGISSLHHVVQTALNKRLGLWERYCLLHCFSVPEGFSSDRPNLLGDILSLQDGLHNAELDSQLVSLRKKLALIENESSALEREIHLLENQSVLHDSYHQSLSEVVHLLNEDSVNKLFQDVETSASKLYKELEVLQQKQTVRGGIAKDAECLNGECWRNSQGPSTKLVLEDLQRAADLVKVFRKP